MLLFQLPLLLLLLLMFTISKCFLIKKIRFIHNYNYIKTKNIKYNDDIFRRLSGYVKKEKEETFLLSISTNKDFQDELLPFKKSFQHINDEQWKQLNQLAIKLYDWNSKINLVSRKDIDSLILNHIIPSLSISLVKQFTSNEKVIDIGTGGGLPGLPMAIACPNASFTLLDSNGKKITAVKDMAESIGLKNVKTVNARAEDINETYDFMMGRAVSAVPTFLGFSSHFVNGKSQTKSIQSHNNITIKSGLLYLKGGDFGDELNEAKINNYHLFPVNKLVPIDSDKNVLYVPSEEIVIFHNNKIKKQSSEVKLKIKKL